MDEIRWEFYPLVAMNVHGRHWLTMQSQLQLAPKTIDAYGRSLNDFLAFCQRLEVEPSTIVREQVALYVQDLAQRPNPKGAKVLSLESGRGLSNATMHQRITVLRLFCDSLVERQLRSGVVITSQGKPLGECVLAGCSLGTKNCPGYPPIRSGNICSMASKGNFCAIR